MGQLSVDLGAQVGRKKRSLRKEERLGLSFPRYFTARLAAGRTPYDEVQWEKRTASIGNDKGAVIFEQRDIEVPASWSQTATNIVASKYFHGRMGTPEREHSVAQLVHRVVDTIAEWGLEGRYFSTPEDAASFRDELAHLMLTQKACFNSPVWFNVGVREENRGYGWYYEEETDSIKKLDKSNYKPQCSACFINSVADSLESILDLAKTEGMLFKWGSGTGTNLSSLREENAILWGGGRASGPLSFMKGFDAFAGVIKSGGKTRRAAKMVILNAEHPDVEQFIWCKAKEEKKAHTLIDAGYDASLDGDAYSSIFFQNANNSVRATDEFMQAVDSDGDWSTKSVVDGKPVKTFRARDLMRGIAEATWQCGDPGMQFDTTVNKWHTSKNTARINASNPCSEYMFLDDSACNLASLNLMKFLKADGAFDVEAFRHAVDTVTLAQEIIVDNASYPTEKIARNSHDYRPLGLGFANLGSLLMSLGVPYDSNSGRAWAGAITAVMCGQAYLTSARTAEVVGPCPGYSINEQPFLEVIKMHGAAVAGIDSKLVPAALLEGAKQCWEQAYELGRHAGYRNAQTTVIAPTGTIGFMMDCDTTGVEPDLALVKYKKLVGGGMIKIVNNTVPQALIRLGYTPEQMEAIVSYIDSTGTIEGAPGLKPEHLPVFDCSFRPQNGTRSIHYMGHVRMMAAVQPFISGAISKTINMPEESTVDEVMTAYVEGWKLGLKAIAIYRDGSKRVQPLSSGTGKGEKKHTSAAPVQSVRVEEKIVYRPIRRKLPDERTSITHKFSIAGHEGYITVGLFEDNTPGEIFITMAKEGSTISGLMDSFATAVSYGLQYGVPLKFFVDKFSHVRFEPSGYTGNEKIPYAKSIMDYIFRWLAVKFIGPEAVENEAGESMRLRPTEPEPQQRLQFAPADGMEDAPICSECGGLMTRNGACYKCENCGGTSGCS
ncbi:MAG: vitamin B12-dependent ribonucleotide reductase [Bryobacteraceae bacterium]|nr:vitamin B12-dependent ribonucleotide reductase [Solibacteraceae bacterium]MCL4842266.1 vitamin B12-dependent ribonucleotide reductase [Bryobacteraceae bacterium]MCO5350942.1 vitamin B12-dependent ribonucleotide reductase [Bryobacteraceae bacterium]